MSGIRGKLNLSLENTSNKLKQARNMQVLKRNMSYEISGEKRGPQLQFWEREWDKTIKQAMYEVGGGGKNRKYLGKGGEAGREKNLPLC